MPFYIIDTATDERVNDFGSGSTLSKSDLGNFTVEYVPESTTTSSVQFLVNGSSVRTDEDGPFFLTGTGPTPSGLAGAELANGTANITAIEKNASGQEVLSTTAETTITGSLGEFQSANGGGSSSPTIENPSEFSIEGEAEGEAEAEVETEVDDDAAGAAAAIGASAAAFGSNAITQTAASGSLDVSLRSESDRVEAQPDDLTGPGGPGTPGIGGDTAGDTSGDAGPDREARVDVISSEAEAEVEVETAVEAEVGFGSASVAVGTAAAAAAVGTSTYVQNNGDPRAFASETTTSIDVASSSNTSISDNDGEINYNVTDDPNQTVFSSPAAADTGSTSQGPGPDGLIPGDGDNFRKAGIETEVEVEAEAEAEAETGIGVAAAGVSGGSGVAVAGDFVAADTETAVVTSTSTSTVTEQQSTLFDNTTENAAAVNTVAPTISSISTSGTTVNFLNGTTSANQPDADDPQVVVDQSGSGDGIPQGYAETEAEAEAEAEAEVEASVGNNSAAVAAVATGGGGASGINATALVSSSVSASTSTAENAGEEVGRNDLVETTSDRSANDPDTVEDQVFNRTDAQGNLIVDPAEAEAEVEAETEVNLSPNNPEVSAVTSLDALGNATSGSSVALSGAIVDREGVVNEGIQGVGERPEIVDEPTRVREVLSDEDAEVVVANGNVEIEQEAEAEVEAEAEIGFNSAAAGSAAVAVQAGNSAIGATAEGTTATSASTSVFDNGENAFSNRDAPGPEPLGAFGNVIISDASLSDFIFEIEVEAEAEAEVGINAGAAAAAAGAGGREGIESDVATDSSTNAAAAAAASGANTEIIIRIPEDGEAGEVYAYARAWDPDGGGVAVAVAVAGLTVIGGLDNESELEAEGLFEAIVEVRIDTSALTDAEASFLFDLASANEATGNVSEQEPEGIDSQVGESETEVEAEAEAEAGYGVAAAAAGAASAALFSDAQASTSTSSRSLDVAFGEGLVGTNADDNLAGTSAIDQLIGGKGNDTLAGNAGGDRLDGGAGNDNLNGGAGNDSLSGGAGNDRLEGGTGNDFIDGQTGNDTAVIQEIGADDRIFADTAGKVYVVTDNGAEVDIYTGIETFETPSETIALADVEQFDGLSYIASNIGDFNTDQLSKLTIRQLIDLGANQFATSGFAAGNTVAGFSAENYLAANPVLAEQLEGQPQAATLQFIQEGAAEGNDAGAEGSQSLSEVNSIAIGRADSYKAAGDFNVSASKGVLANDFDPNGDALTAELVQGPASGVVTLNPDGSFRYDGIEGFSGEESFTYTVSDGTDVSEAISVSLNIGMAGAGGGAGKPSGGTGSDSGEGSNANGEVGNSGTGSFVDASGTASANSSAGDDTFNGTSGADIASGGAGNDVLNGGAGDDVLGGGAGADELNGGTGNDVLNGLESGAFAMDMLDGGSGSDTYRVNGDNALQQSDVVTESVGNSGSDEIVSYGSFFADTNGVAESLTIADSAARDGGYSYLEGGTSSKEINGSALNDVISTGTGNSRIDAGAGDDVITFETEQGSGSTLFVGADSGNDFIFGADSDSDLIDLSNAGLDAGVTSTEFFASAVENGASNSVNFQLSPGNSLTFLDTSLDDLSAQMFLV